MSIGYEVDLNAQTALIDGKPVNYQLAKSNAQKKLEYSLQAPIISVLLETHPDTTMWTQMSRYLFS